MKKKKSEPKEGVPSLRKNKEALQGGAHDSSVLRKAGEAERRAKITSGNLILSEKRNIKRAQPKLPQN